MKKGILQWLSFIILSGYHITCNAQSARLSEQIGKYVHHQLIQGGVSFKLTNATVNITAYNATTI